MGRTFAAAAAVLCVPTTLGLVPHTPAPPLAARRPSAAPSWSGVGVPSGGHCGHRHRATPTATAMSSTVASPRGGYYDDGAWGDEDDFYTSDEWLGIADDRWEQRCNADVLPPPEGTPRATPRQRHATPRHANATCQSPTSPSPGWLDRRR